MNVRRRLQMILASSLAALSLLIAVPVAVQAATPAETACGGLANAVSGVNCNNEPAATRGVSNVFMNVISILSYVVGGVCVLMIIIGGFRYVISGGDTNGVQGAKNTILYAVVGLVIVLFSRVIIGFVYTQVVRS